MVKRMATVRRIVTCRIRTYEGGHIRVLVRDMLHAVIHGDERRRATLLTLESRSNLAQPPVERRLVFLRVLGLSMDLDVRSLKVVFQMVVESHVVDRNARITTISDEFHLEAGQKWLNSVLAKVEVICNTLTISDSRGLDSRGHFQRPGPTLRLFMHHARARFEKDETFISTLGRLSTLIRSQTGRLVTTDATTLNPT